MKLRWALGLTLSLFFGTVLLADDSPHLLLGLPSKATSDPANKDDFLMQKKYFALSYNSSKGTPRWVSWQVTKDTITGHAKRKRVFDTDTTLPAGFTRVDTKDYSG